MTTLVDYKRVIYDFNDTRMDVLHECVHDIFTAQGHRSPAATALELGDKCMSYQSLLSAAKCAATNIDKQASVEARTIVGLMAPRSFEFMVGMFCILFKGCAFLPFDLELPEQRIAYMLEDTHAAVIMLVRQALHVVPASVSKVFIDTLPSFAADSQAEHAGSATRADLMYVLFTSGSTGRPKGVMIEHRSAVNFTFALDSVLKLHTTDRWFQWFSPSFDPSIMDYILPLLKGATLILWHGNDKVLALEHSRATITGITPGFMTQHNPELLPTLRLITPCGDPLPISLGQQWACCMQVLNGYGPTEATIYASTFRVEKHDKIMSIGKPLANYLCYVLLDGFQPAHISGHGELHIGGVGVARGYVNRPELTSERFVSNMFADGRMYRTGDLASWREDGNLLCHGRIDLQVKLRGQRVELSEIEAVAAEFPSVTEAAAILANKDEASAHLQLFVTGTNVESAALSEWIRSRLAGYMVPRHIFVIQRMPKNPSGKLDRKALPSATLLQFDGEAVTASLMLSANAVGHGSSRKSGYHYDTCTLRTILELATQSTGLPASSMTQTAVIGLDSIASVAFARKLSQRLSVSITSHDILQYPTLSALAQGVEQRTPGADASMSAAVVGLRGLLVLIGPVNHAAFLFGMPYIWAATNYRTHVFFYVFLSLTSYSLTIQLQACQHSSASSCEAARRFYSRQFKKIAPIYFMSLMIHMLSDSNAPPLVFWVAMQGWYFLPWEPQRYDALQFGGEMWWWTSYVTFILCAPVLYAFTMVHTNIEKLLPKLLPVGFFLAYASFAMKAAVCVFFYLPTAKTTSEIFQSYHIEYFPPFHFSYAVLGMLVAITFELDMSLFMPRILPRWHADFLLVCLLCVTFTKPQYELALQHPTDAEMLEAVLLRPMQLILIGMIGRAIATSGKMRGVFLSMLHSRILQEAGNRALVIYAFHLPILALIRKTVCGSSCSTPSELFLDVIHHVLDKELQHTPLRYIGALSTALCIVYLIQDGHDSIYDSCRQAGSQLRFTTHSSKQQDGTLMV